MQLAKTCVCRHVSEIQLTMTTKDILPVFQMTSLYCKTTFWSSHRRNCIFVLGPDGPGQTQWLCWRLSDCIFRFTLTHCCDVFQKNNMVSHAYLRWHLKGCLIHRCKCFGQVYTNPFQKMPAVQQQNPLELPHASANVRMGPPFSQYG